MLSSVRQSRFRHRLLVAWCAAGMAVAGLVFAPAMPAAAGPTTAGPTTAGPTTAGPTTAGVRAATSTGTSGSKTSISTTQFVNQFDTEPYVGNGYFSQRIPARSCSIRACRRSCRASR